MIPELNAPQQNWIEWLTDTAVTIQSLKLTKGAVMVHGLPLKTADDIARARDALGIPSFQSTERFGRRQEHRNGVVSPIHWPKERELCPYQEESFNLVVPNTVLTGCIRSPEKGGEVALSDARQIIDHLPPKLTEQLRIDGWIMTRVFHPQFGISWQDAFGCTDRDALSALFAQHEITHEWLYDGALRLRRQRPAFRMHPKTDVDCWFNQLAFLNRGSLEPRERELLSLAFGNDLPVDTALGNGQPLPEADLATIQDAYDATTTKMAWRAGDLLIVDNLLTAQGRSPLVGTPEYWIAFGDPVKE